MRPRAPTPLNIRMATAVNPFGASSSSIRGARREKVLVFSGKRIPPGSLVILAGSSSSDSGGNKRVGALNDKGSCKRFSERAGRNLRERRAGPEIRTMQEPTLLP